MQLVKWNYLEDCTVFEVIHFTNLCPSRAEALALQLPHSLETATHALCQRMQPTPVTCGKLLRVQIRFRLLHAMRKAVPRLTWHRPREAVRQALPHVAYHRLVNVDVSQATSEPATVRVCVA